MLRMTPSACLEVAGHYRHFPKADEALYQLFCKRRKAGRPVSIRWLLLKYKFYVNKYYPDKPCKANKTVVKRWCRKYKVVQRRKTNKKRESREDRLAACRLYHWQNISKRSSGEQVDGVYGRIKPVNTFSLDQSPVPFALQSGVTYEQRGVTEVWVNQPAAGRWTLFNSSMIPRRFCVIGHSKRSFSVNMCTCSRAGLEKRQATLQLMFRCPYDRETAEAARRPSLSFTRAAVARG